MEKVNNKLNIEEALEQFKNGKMLICAGEIAKYYQSLGGKVIFFGKPFKEVFKLCLTQIQKLNPVIDINDIIVIGDSLETDILGANKAQIKSILIGSGIHKNAIYSSLSKESHSDLLKLLFDQYKAYPNYIISKLSY